MSQANTTGSTTGREAGREGGREAGREETREPNENRSRKMSSKRRTRDPEAMLESVPRILDGVDLSAARERIIDEVRARPLAAVAVAFGVGVAVSHVLTSRLARLALVTAAGYAAKELVDTNILDVIRGEEDELLDAAEAPHRNR